MATDQTMTQEYGGRRAAEGRVEKQENRMTLDTIATHDTDSSTADQQDARIAWCREHIAGFADLHDHSLKARRDTEESRRRLGRQIAPPTVLANYAANKAGRAA